MNDYEKLYRKLLDLTQDLKFIKGIINHNSGAAIQAKWVSKQEAIAITGLKERALMDRTVLRDPVHGIFNVSQTGKNMRFWKKDLEQYVLDNSTFSGAFIIKKAARQ
jgi:hypothetical protein